jgi:hypothetical protein
MSLQTCQPGDTNGFPVQLAQTLSTPWTGKDSTSVKNDLKSLTVPTDFSVSWGPTAQSANISVASTSSIFQIRGIDTVASATTLTYGKAEYKCSSVLSIVKNQHSKLLSTTDASYEVILAFQIKEKYLNTSSPDIILLCRPIVFSTWNTSPFWSTVNTAVLRNTPQSTVVDLSSIFAYNSSTLMPMITYQTCTPVKLLNYKGKSSVIGSLNIRVNVVTQPIHIAADDNGMGKCSSVMRYTLVTEPSHPVNIFENVSSNTKLQFQDGLGPDKFPSAAIENLIPQVSSTSIATFSEIMNKFIILVPEAFLGKSLAEISNIATPPPLPKKKKAFKCYRIDPEKDIKDDQILVDPTTGQSLTETMNQEAIESAGGESSLINLGEGSNTSSGMMPGDIQQGFFILFTVIGSLSLMAYIVYICNMVFFVKDIQNGIYNTIIFCGLLIGLIIINVFFGKTTS